MEFLDRYKANNNNDYYKIYDKNGKYLKDINIAEEKSLTDEYLYGVTCFVINEKSEVLMEVRANTELTPGKIDLVSGHVNGGESGLNAVIRELREEIGIINDMPNRLYKVCSLAKPLGFESKGKIRNFFIDFYCVLTRTENVTLLQKSEVEELKWIPLETAFEMIKQGKTKFPKQAGNVNYDQIFSNVRTICLSREEQDFLTR